MGTEEKEKQATVIELFDGFIISVDRYSYTLQKQSGIDKKTGMPNYRNVSYHGSLDQALKACKKEYTRKIIMDHNILSLDDAIAIIVRSNNHFEYFIKSNFDGVVS